jgi:transposase
MSESFKPYRPDQLLLLPPSLHDWLPEDHLVYFLSDVVEQLDLAVITESYRRDQGGQPPYHPAMMVKLLLYAYCVGVPSSRKIEERTHTDIAFRVLAAGDHPDHDTIAAFRKRHLKALAALFVQVLTLCRQAGLVKLGCVALDGTKIRANASKHKAMSYGRMVESEAKLQAEVDELLRRAEAADEEEDSRHGRRRRGDELPGELRRRQDRLRVIREAKQALEAEARARAEAIRQTDEEDRKRREAAGEPAKRGRRPEPCETPDPKAQRNFTDPESRIMVEGSTKAFAQAYNGQVAVDAGSQVIVACHVTRQANDKQQLVPLVEGIKANTGSVPKQALADSGYFSEANVTYLEGEGVDPFLAVGRQKHGERPEAPRGRVPKSATVADRMGRKLRTKRGRATYAKRKGTVEPALGQIKEARGLRRFLLRGLESVGFEWDLWCLTHNLLKLFRSGWASASA